VVVEVEAMAAEGVGYCLVTTGVGER
jgi:hypothetical protein